MIVASRKGETNMLVVYGDLVVWQDVDVVDDDFVGLDTWTYQDMRINPRRLKVTRLKYSDDLGFSSRKVMR